LQNLIGVLMLAFLTTFIVDFIWCNSLKRDIPVATLGYMYVGGS